MLKKISFVFLLVSQFVSAQLVNIESKRMQTDSIRFVLKSDATFSYNNNDGDYIYQIEGALSTQLKSKDLKKIFFLIGNYKLIRAEEKDFQNSWFAHLRFNYKLSKMLRLESFIQSQHNELLDINSRNLIGAGIRLKLISKEHLKLYLGNAYMYEEEKSNAFNKRFYNHRHSSYISVSATFNESKLNLLNTVYYQPLYEDFGNYRILEQFKAEIPISKSLNLFTLFNYYLDSLTPEDNREYTSNISVGIGWQLN